MTETPKSTTCHRCGGTKKFNGRPCALCKGLGRLVRVPVFTTVTHVAERVIVVNGRGIQRCCICGEKLLDTKGMAVPLGPDGKPQGVGVWQPGDLVRVNGSGRQLLAGHWNSDDLPPDFCIESVE